MDRERKEHFMLWNPLRSKGESQSLSWTSWALSVKHNMSHIGMISASGPSSDGLEMFNRHCPKWIMREKSALC